MLPEIRVRVVAAHPEVVTPIPDGALREHLLLRLLAAAEHQDPVATQRILDAVLDHEFLGPQILGAVMTRLGRTAAGM